MKPDTQILDGWRMEFPDFAVPAKIANHPRLTDVSWHNDASPRFLINGDETRSLWVDHPNIEERECADGKRFTIEHDGNSIFESDDLAEVLKRLARVRDPIFQRISDATCNLASFGHYCIEERSRLLTPKEITDAKADAQAIIDGLSKLKPVVIPEIEPLARKFAEIVLRDVGKENHVELFIKTRAINQANEEHCATHDYCDANMSMAEAWEELTGAEPFDDMGSDDANEAARIAETNAMNTAWALAKQNLFWLI